MCGVVGHSIGDPDVFGPLGSASGTVSHKHGSGSLRHQAKICSKKNLDFFVTFFDECASVPDPYLFGPRGSASGFVGHRYGSGSGLKCHGSLTLVGYALPVA
jgi:hypothetical protein